MHFVFIIIEIESTIVSNKRFVFESGDTGLFCSARRKQRRDKKNRVINKPTI